MSGKRGFTLLEMLVASTIMAVAIVGLFGAIGGATRNAAHLRDYDRVTQLARLRMNDFLADDAGGVPLGGTFDPILTGGLEAGWDARISTVEMPPGAMVGQPCLQRVELQVWWMAGEQKRTFLLDAYRTHFLRAGE
jgi:general secretion pathway protein I